MTILEEAEELLIKVAQLASPEKLPETYHENCKRVWEAFKLGQSHQQLKDKETANCSCGPDATINIKTMLCQRCGLSRA